MDDKDEIILSIVSDSLGDHRRTSEGNAQKYYNCQSDYCRRDVDKYNLAYHAERKIFKCWKCGVKGSVFSLVGRFGAQIQVDKLKLMLPNYEYKHHFFEKPKTDHNTILCDLPDEYKPLWKKNETFKYDNALKYAMEERALSMEEIVKYKIGYTEDGPKKLRIILPSQNAKGKINYYEARAYWSKLVQTYIKPDSPNSHEIIYNEKFINWNLPVYLVEGVFDSYRIPNSIPLLGKEPSDVLIMKLLEYKPKVILCLDEDAIKDAFSIYNDLRSIGLDMFFINMAGKDDVSKLYEKNGKSAIIDLLSNPKRLTMGYFLETIMKYERN